MPHVIEYDRLSTNGFEWREKPLWSNEAPPDASQVAVCRQFLQACERTKSARIYSYWLKHVIERWAGEHITNGALLQAALVEGLVLKPEGWLSPNGHIGVSRRSILGVVAMTCKHTSLDFSGRCRSCEQMLRAR